MPTSHSRKVRFFWILALVVIAVVWVVGAYILTPMIIERAYRGESLAVFNRMIRGQAHIPVTEYLARWSRPLSKVSCALAILWVYSLLAVVGLTREGKSGLSDSAGKVAMSRPRVRVVYALMAVILGGSAYDVVRDKEHWPFSQYSMDSELVLSRKFSIIRLYGVVQQSPLVEIQLDNNRYLRPFDASRLSEALGRALRQGKLEEGLADCLRRYETLRRAGIHGGPPLVGLRAYMVTWTVEESVSNIDRPDHKELLGEVVLRGAGSD